MLLLQELLKDWPCVLKGAKFSIPILGVTENSKNVKPGYMFIARKGESKDGISFIEEAIRHGAAAIVVDRPISIALPEEIPVIIVADCRKFLSHVSARLAGNPSERLKIIAITGTNGKTTVSHFIGQLLKGMGIKTAVLGTLGVFIDGRRYSCDIPQMTTLTSEYLHPLLKEFEVQGITHVVMEASSLGLSTFRLEDCHIDVGVLLNIGVDHYEEHGCREAYIQAKQKLVLMAESLVVNQDDEVCMEMIRGAEQPITFFGKGPAADLQLIEEHEGLSVKANAVKSNFQLPLFEDFNRLNALTAISTLNVLSFNIAKVLNHTAVLTLPEGRMQRVEQGGVTVIVDYAHTPDALETVLRSIAKLSKRRIITVFGCGGNRDKGKRKEMGEIAAFYSSQVFVTSDNPRNENPLAIIEDITEGFHSSCTAVKIEPDREKAIKKAIASAEEGDIILIAGKGHEKTQQIARKTYPFSDIEVATQALLTKI